MGTESWNTLEEYVETPTVIGYTKAEGAFGHYVWVSGHWLGDWIGSGGWAYYQDWFGVGIGSVYFPAAVPKPTPEYLGQEEDGLRAGGCGEFSISVYALIVNDSQKPVGSQGPRKPPSNFDECMDACRTMLSREQERCTKQRDKCLDKAKTPEQKMKCREDYIDCIGTASGAYYSCTYLCFDYPDAPREKRPVWPPDRGFPGIIDPQAPNYPPCFDRNKDLPLPPPPDSWRPKPKKEK